MKSPRQKIVRITTVPQSFRGLLRGQLRFMSDHYDMIGISSPGEILAEVADYEQVRFMPLEMTRTISPIKDIISVWRLFRIFKAKRPFIVHTHTPKAGIVGMLAAKLAGVPHRLHTVAGLPLLEARGFKRTILDFVEKLTYSCATKVYPNSFGLYEIILKNKYAPQGKIKVIANGSSNGINTHYFDPTQIGDAQKNTLRQSLGLNERDFVFIFVGRIVRDKGINELAEAFRTLSVEFPNVKLLLLGKSEDDLDPVLPATKREIAENPSIIAAGFQSDIRPYLAIADALVFPSYREGFPNVVMQAGAMGLPAIVSNINGCNEIIREGVNGLIIPPKNTDKLFDVMRRLLTGDALRGVMRENAREMIVSRYDQNRMWEAILEEYRVLERVREKH
jgi:glycosyltransferase involved in cell wall biosynthesis